MLIIVSQVDNKFGVWGQILILYNRSKKLVSEFGIQDYG
jgi:hypothetical protein